MRSSTIVAVQGIFSFVLQAFAYPWVTKYVNIPYLASIGMVIQVVSYILMGAVNNAYGNIAASFILWAGASCCSPTSASILSVETGKNGLMNRLQPVPSIKELFFRGITSVIHPLSSFLLWFYLQSTPTTRKLSTTSRLLLRLLVCASWPI